MLCQSKESLVDSTPGLTRDIIKKQVNELLRVPLILYDTPGFEIKNNNKLSVIDDKISK